MAGDPTVRTIDVDSQVADYGTVKAITTGNPAMVRLAELDNQISTLRRQQVAHEREQLRLGHAHTDAVRAATVLEERLTTLGEVLARRRDTRGDRFALTIHTATGAQRTYQERDIAGVALLDTIRALHTRTGYTPLDPVQVATLGGVDVYADRGYDGRYSVWVEGLKAHEGRRLGRFYDLTPATVPPSPLVSGLEAQLRGLDDRRVRLILDRDTARANAATAHSRLGRPWLGADTLAAAQAELADLAGSLRADLDTEDLADQESPDTPPVEPAPPPALSAPAVLDQPAPPAEPDEVVIHLGHSADRTPDGQLPRQDPTQLWTLQPGRDTTSMRARIRDRDEQLRARWIETFTGIPATASWRPSPIPHTQLARVARAQMPASDTIVAVTCTGPDGHNWTLHDVVPLTVDQARLSAGKAAEEALRAAYQLHPALPRGQHQWFQCALFHTDGMPIISRCARVDWSATHVQALIYAAPDGTILQSVTDLLPAPAAQSPHVAAFPKGAPTPTAPIRHPDSSAGRLTDRPVTETPRHAR